MKLNPFAKDDVKKSKAPKKELVSVMEEIVETKPSNATVNYSAGAYRVLKNFYISEK